MKFLIAIALLLATTAKGDTCRAFTFTIVDLDQRVVRGVDLRVDTTGTRDTSGDDGIVRFCISGGNAGDRVSITLLDPRYKLLSPPLFALGRAGFAPPIVVCPRSGCDGLSPAQVRALNAQVARSLSGASAELRAAVPATWNRSLAAQELGAPQLREEVRLRVLRVEAATQASVLLKTFLNKGREIVARFQRYGAEALDYPTPGPLIELKSAIKAYNPVYDELNEKADAYRKATADSWGPERSEQFRQLVAEALRIHEQIFELNELGSLINDCRLNAKERCPDRAAARKRIQVGAGRIAEDVDRQLDAFAAETTTFLEGLNEGLFE